MRRQSRSTMAPWSRFGGTHFVYRVSVRREPEGDSTLTQVKPTAAKANVDVDADSDKTTFVGSAHSFLDIFCVDQPIPHEDEVNQEALPDAAESKKEGERRRERSKFGMMFSALRAAFTGNERVTTKRGLIIGAVVIAALAAIATAIFFNGSSERQVKGLIASGQFERAASVASDYLQRHPNDPRFSALDTEALLKAKVPEWLAALRSNQFDKASAVIAQMNQLGANNTDVRPLVDELAWIGKLESFVLGRGGPDAPIRIYADEDRIGEILKHWEDDASSHQRSLDRIASYVPEFATPYAEALSHLRKLQSDDSVYLAAIERPEGEHREGAEPGSCGSAGRRIERLRGQVPAPRRTRSRARGLAAIPRFAETGTRREPRTARRGAGQSQVHDAAIPGAVPATEREPSAVAGCGQPIPKRAAGMAQRPRHRPSTACRRCRRVRGPM